jgi:hypothetical protein
LRGLASILLALTFVAICLGPHTIRLLHPSLYTDDVRRIEDLQTRPLAKLLFRPIQEHMAPFFEMVSWFVWTLAGHQVSSCPLAFTLASYVPFVLSLVLLGLLIRREMGSSTTALTMIVALAVASIDVEVLYWYSASSFTWALVWTLVSLLCAASAMESKGPARWVAAALAAALAPASSGIGLLAGPLGAIRVGARSEREGIQGTRLLALLPLSGTVLFLSVCSVFQYRDLMASSLAKRCDLGTALIAASAAPTHVLLPGLVGLRGLDRWLALWLNLALSAAVLIGVLLWAARSTHRGLILSGLWLILGGYLLTYVCRTQFGMDSLFKIERYHLFPLVGLILWIALALQPLLRRLDRNRLASLAGAIALAAPLMAVHLPVNLNRSRHFHYPGQPLTLVAVERLGNVCRRTHITRDQAIAALDPIWLSWGQPLGLLPPSVASPEVPDALVRETLMAALSGSDREALCSGMDMAPYMCPAEPRVVTDPEPPGAVRSVLTNEQPTPSSAGRSRVELTLANRVIEISSPGPGPSSSSGQELVLSLPSGPSIPTLEIWWTGTTGDWSALRSVRWTPKRSQTGRDWILPLERLPHWDPAHARRIQIRSRPVNFIAISKLRNLR